MDPEAESAPLRGDWQAPARPGRSVRITPSARPARQAPTEPTAKPAGRPASPGEAEAAAVQKRAEGRAKVPRKFRDSFKRFFFSPTGALKIIRLALLIGALVYFIIAEAQEYFIAITVLETCIVVCFILIYMLTLHHLMTFLHWPLLSAEHQEADQAHHEPLLSDTRKTLLVKQSYNHGEVSEGKLKISVHGNFQEGKDLINSFITAVFLLILAALAIQEKERRHLFYIGGRQSCVSSMGRWSPRG
nr:CKLF-like MARVEL transmembrane domain-containing protein 1 [Camelus dromedarius]